EIMEHRYPVRVEEFSVRRGSGGNGAHTGGDGVVRRLRFTEPVSLSVLTQNRVRGPYGLDGGEPGTPGAQRVEHAGGRVTRLAPADTLDLQADDVFVLETPGGGGCGQPE